MKKKGLVAIVAALALCGCTQKAENEFVLKGNISNYPNEKIYFMLGNAMGGNPVLDSADVTDGKFEYRGFVDEPQRLSITDRIVSMSKYDPNVKGISIYVEPKVMNLSMEWFAPQENMQNTIKEYTLEGSTTDGEGKIFNKMLEEAKADFADSVLAFAHKYPNSYVAAHMLEIYEGSISLEKLKKSYEALSEVAKGYTPGKNVAQVIEKRESIVPGKPVPQFTRTDINGNTFSMSDLEGKVVLIDFWASWCKPCRASMPHVKELHKKYKDKGFEVLCIADNDNDEQTWKKAVEVDGTEDFIHILRGLKMTDYGFDRSNDLSDLFTTHVLPTKFLVGADGNFVLTFASDEELDAKLKELFGF